MELSLHPFPQSRIQFLRVNKPTLSIRASYCWGHGKPRWGQGKNCHKMFLCFEQTHTKLAYASKPNLSQKKNTVLVIKVWGICSPNHITKGLWTPTTWKARDGECPYRYAIRKCDWNTGSTKQAKNGRIDPTEDCAALLTLQSYSHTGREGEG